MPVCMYCTEVVYDIGDSGGLTYNNNYVQLFGMYNTSVTVELCIDSDYSATPLFRTPLGQLQVS